MGSDIANSGHFCFIHFYMVFCWSVNVADVNTENYDLSAKNPNRAEEAPLREPKTILKEMRELDVKTKGLLDNIMALLT